MTAIEKKICNDVLTEGTLIGKTEFACEGIAVESYEVEYLGEHYVMTKHNGEWIYFHHC